MIISHKHQFIFIKTMKTAGTSVEIALSKYLGDDDIITPIAPEDEAMRRELGYRGPQNYQLPGRNFSLVQRARAFVGRRKLGYFNHCSATFIRQHLDPKIWNSYFKFCFERNPWDKAVSLYYYRNTSEPRPSISEFLERQGNSIVPGRELYTIDGEVVVDRLCRYERIGEEMQELTERLGLPEIPVLPRAKSKQRVDKRHYREILSTADRDRIAQVFASEIASLGYAW